MVLTLRMIQLLSAFAGSLGFALLFNVRGYRLLWSASSGLISWGIYLLCSIYYELGDFNSYIISAACLTLYAEILARLQKAPATVYLVVGMIPLLPGGSLYNTLHHAVAGNWSAFGTSGIYTLMLAIAIALGIILMMSLLRAYFVTLDFIAKYKAKAKLKIKLQNKSN